MVKTWLKRNLGWSLLLLGFALIYFLPYMRSGLPVTHDGENHVARMMQYFVAIRQGQFPPRLAPTLLNGYGYPVFNYNYPLANILSLPFALVRANPETIFKILVVTAVIGGTVGVWWWLKKLGLKPKERILPTGVWLLSPYLFSAIWYRGSIGEVLAYALVPWLLVLFELVFLSKQNPQSRPWLRVVLVITQAAFLLSHNVMVLLLMPLIGLYQIVRLSHQNGFSYQKLWLGGWVLSICLTMWFWLPALLEKSAVVLDQVSLSQDYQQHFLQPPQLISIFPQPGLSFAGSVDSLGMGLGPLGLMVLGVGIYWCVRSRQLLKAAVVATIILAFMLIWLQTASSAWFWQLLPLVNYVQFPWRLGLPLSLILVLVAVNFSSKSRASKGWWWGLLLVTLGIYVVSWPTNFFHKTRLDYMVYPLSTTTSEENIPQTFTFPYASKTSGEMEVLSGEGEVSVIAPSTTSAKHYQVNCHTDCIVVEPTAWFPGFLTSANGSFVPYIDDATIGGRIAYELPAGNWEMRTFFTQNTPARLIGNGLFFVSLIRLIYSWVSQRANFSRFTKRVK